jgi:hypothetical protein
MSDSISSNNTHQSPRPWWSFGHVWLVIAGPLVVVLASFMTFYLAAHGQDPVLTESSVEAQRDNADAQTRLAPAMQARNHAATGSVPPPAPQTKP